MLTFTLYPQSTNTVSQQNFNEYYEYLTQLTPRLEGSVREQNAIAYIINKLNNLSLSYVTDDLSQVENTHSFSSSIRVEIPGQRQDTLLIAIPLSAKRNSQSPHDGSANIALALTLLDIYSSIKPELTLNFLFLGAEQGSSEEYPIGSKYFLSEYFPTAPTALFYLDMKDLPQRITIQTGGDGIISPYWLIKESTRALKQADIFFLLKGNETQVLRLGLPSGYNKISPYLNEQIPAILFETGDNVLANNEEREEWVQNFDQFIQQFMINNKSGLSEEWDLHYLFFQVRENFFLLTEQTLTIFLLASLLVLYILTSIFQKNFNSRVGKVILGFWNFPLLFVLLFTIFYLSTIILNLVIEIRSFSDLWTYIPLIFLWLKIAVTAFLFMLFFAAFKHLPISRNPKLYSSIALLLFLVLFVVALIYNISYSYYPLWALVMTILFIMIPKKELKFLALGASPIWFIKASVDVFSIPEYTIVRGLLLSSVQGNLILGLIIFPFALLITSYHFLPNNHPLRGSQYVTLGVTGVSGILALGLFIFILNYNPFTLENPQPINVTVEADMQEQKHQMTITTPMPVEELTFNILGSEYVLPAKEQEASYDLPFTPDLLMVDSFGNAFLDRTHYEIVIFPLGEPRKIDLTLTGDNFSIYDLNFPFDIYPADNKAIIHIGENPPIPLILDITLNGDADTALDINTYYDQLPYRFVFDDPFFKLIEHMKIHTKYQIP